MNKVPTRRPVHCHKDFSCRPIFQPMSTSYSRNFYHTALVHTLLGTLYRGLQLWLGSFDAWRVSYSSRWPLNHPQIFQESVSGIWNPLFSSLCSALIPLWLAEIYFLFIHLLRLCLWGLTGEVVSLVLSRKEVFSFLIALHCLQWFRKHLLVCSYFAIAPLCSSLLLKWVDTTVLLLSFLAF